MVPEGSPEGRLKGRGQPVTPPSQPEFTLAQYSQHGEGVTTAQGQLHMEEGHGHSPPRIFMSELKRGFGAFVSLEIPLARASPELRTKFLPQLPMPVTYHWDFSLIKTLLQTFLKIF